MNKHSSKNDRREQQAMPFNEALKRVWAAPPMPKNRSKPAVNGEGSPARKVDSMEQIRKALNVVNAIQTDMHSIPDEVSISGGSRINLGDINKKITTRQANR